MVAGSLGPPLTRLSEALNEQDTQEGRPVSLTYIGVSIDGRSEVREYRWPGGRAANRLASVEAALDLAADVLTGDKVRD